MNTLWKWFQSKPRMALDEAIVAFKVTPAQWFWYRKLPYQWSMPALGLQHAIYLDDVCVLVEGHPLAYIEGARCHIGDYAVIQHIAVETLLVRKHIGTTLLRAYAHELSVRYGVNRIVFSETHPHFQEAGYPAFFHSLGATALPRNPRMHRPHCPDFEWLESNWNLPG